MTTSVFLANLVWVLLLVNWLAEWNWKEKFHDIKSNHLLQAFGVLLAVHLIWLIGTANMSYAFFDLQKKLPLFVLPLVILTTAPTNLRERRIIGFFYIGTLTVVTLIGLVRYLTIDRLPYRQIVPHISHIRFALNLCLAIIILVRAAVKSHQVVPRLAFGALSLWFVAFLLLLHANTAFIILAITAPILMLAYGRRIPRTPRICAWVVVGLGLSLGLGLATFYTYQYFHLQPLSAQPLVATTANGNAYRHTDDLLIENGNYVHRYICEEEMRNQWAKLSNYPYDSVNADGYTIHPTLLRYLNGLGTTKDSVGMTHLTPRDIAAIEHGIANPTYLEHSPRKIVYAICFEYENYRHYRSVNNFTMLQRLELWRNAWQIFKQHPFFGVGTGDVVDCCHQRLQATQSPLAGSNLHTHNQYLNFLLAFGLLGFGLIAAAFVRAIWLSRSYRSLLFTAILCITLISFTTEDTLETLAGILFVLTSLQLVRTKEEKNSTTTIKS